MGDELTRIEAMRRWRGIEHCCPACGGSGIKVYGSASTWHGGISGQVMTSDICDKCWGSGDSSHPWTNLRTIQLQLASHVKAAKEAAKLQGLAEGLKRFAHWKDGVQYVGTCGTTLKQALEEINHE